MVHYIITGASSGIGAALAAQLLSGSSVVHTISRNPNQELESKSNESGFALHYYRFDLTQLEGIDGLWDSIIRNIAQQDVSELVLFNNAGVVEPIGPVRDADNTAIIANIHTNLLAPVLLSRLFIHLAERLGIRGLIINISSGAASTAYSGWSSYCTSKAGLEMFTRCAGLELDESNRGVRIISVAPGIVDTGMQEKLRSVPQASFPMKKKFLHYKNAGHLLDAAQVAARLINIISSSSLENGAVVDLRTL